MAYTFDEREALEAEKDFLRKKKAFDRLFQKIEKINLKKKKFEENQKKREERKKFYGIDARNNRIQSELEQEVKASKSRTDFRKKKLEDELAFLEGLKANRIEVIKKRSDIEIERISKVFDFKIKSKQDSLTALNLRFQERGQLLEEKVIKKFEKNALRLSLEEKGQIIPQFPDLSEELAKAAEELKKAESLDKHFKEMAQWDDFNKAKDLKEYEDKIKGNQGENNVQGTQATEPVREPV